MSFVWSGNALGSSNGRQSISSMLRCLWLGGLVAIQGGCGSSRNGIPDPTPAIAPRTSDSSRASEADWREAVEWARSPASLGCIELDQPIDERWLLELPPDGAIRGVVLRQGGLGHEGLKHLVGFDRLERLDIRRSAFGETEFQALPQLKQLRLLNIDGATIDSAALEAISRLKQLRSLRLGDASESWPLATELQGFDDLEHLHLIGARITPAARETIDDLPRLRTIYLDQATFDADWLAAWQAARPGRHVHIDELHLDGSRDP